MAAGILHHFVQGWAACSRAADAMIDVFLHQLEPFLGSKLPQVE
jgi:hypothetical protein